jgi:hypothetical protein
MKISEWNELKPDDRLVTKLGNCATVNAITKRGSKSRPNRIDFIEDGKTDILSTCDNEMWEVVK